MYILIYSYNYYPEPIGIAPLMTELAEGLVEQGHKVRVITGMPNYPQRQIYDGYQGKWYLTEQKNGVTIQRSYLRIKSKPNLLDRLLLELSFVFTSLPQALKGPQPDVILLTVPPLLVSLPAALLGWLYNCPIVLNVQDILPEAAIRIGLLKNKWMIRVLTFLEKFAYRNAHTISVISEGFRENLVNKGVPTKKIVCIPNWVNINFIRPLAKKTSHWRTEHQLDGKFVVLYSGNIALTQGLETVVETAVRLRHIQEIVFVIVGESKALQRLQKHCLTCGADNVLLLPLQPREKLPQMLAAANVGLIVQKRNVISFNMPSKIPLLLASGRPIVGSVPKTGTAAQAIQLSGGGIVVDPESPDALADAVQKLYENPTLAAQLGEKGRNFAVENYSFEQALQCYEELFYHVTSQRESTLKVLPKLNSKKSLLGN
ncbi:MULTISPECIES: glycosyltransferase family 4 protein [Cyanophyceae]|uniref:Glycosyltransferase WbuB n=1 Tax=Nodularia spumigena CENA596 TaxID=1819295 RepID=A0A161VRD2_NODSP|nr:MULTISPECIES: glycosyltransferase family 4 protein [Cyanophyceae]MDB9356194.1 glycosyltransferase family 4 protein [Nodularia spumigena CS-587/03]KZL49665.1 glycosyltransferase WbuB [Nodularia spumigena CENA596]MDB9306483.1 glycosyltransferase family 4 protein [Nodularia spumigena CS-591/12]MDB9318401.1 glycosyltransferase family 4 protein [Nodularia spumigena CS-590/01A]MDB9320358.1 glycosyltransferase family 4 protein [Nodularia spumigena CS-591/07A]